MTEKPQPERTPTTPEQREPSRPGGARTSPPTVPERGGPPGPEPTRYGDWEKNGRCIDF